MNDDMKLYWGEIHTHTGYSDGQGTPEEAAAEARAHLDFWACADHICSSAGIESWHTKFMDNWPETQRVISRHNDPGSFVTILAYEYTSIGGDFNIYFPSDEAEGYLPEDVRDFAEFARDNDAILIPHHTGYISGIRGLDWDDFIPDVMPLVEIFSMHGSSECEPGPFPMDLPWMGPRATAGTVREGLNRGHRFGVIGSSDGHGGYPGNYLMGLAAVYAEELTREGLFEAFRSRRCYGVTGDRIVIDFTANGSPMGSEIEPGDCEIEYCVRAMDAIDRVEIVKNGNVFVSDTANESRDDAYRVRLEWGWGRERENTVWDGRLEVERGEILDASPNFGSPGPNRIMSLDHDASEWQTHVNIGLTDEWRHCRNGREATQQIVFTVGGDETTGLNVSTRSHDFSMTLGELCRGSSVVICGDDEFGPKFKFHTARPLGDCESASALVDRAKTGDYYYLRVIQQNGQMAWSSPIFVR
ncbi:MAG: CehA/McbA family metallohydrolase [Armatimonadota bacterium]